MTRYIHKEITIDKKVDEVFEALVSPSQIRAWWHAKTAIVLPQDGGFFAATWGEYEDHPDYITIAAISEFERPYKLKLVYEKYFSKTGPLPFEAKMEVSFSLEDLGNTTLLTVMQNGFPISIAADDYYQGCVKGWEDTLLSMKKMLESKR